MDTLAYLEKHLSLHFLWALATLLIFCGMYSLISREFLSDRATHKDLSLNSYYGFSTGRKRRSIHLQYTCLSSVLVELKMLLFQKISLFQKEWEREKIFPLKYLFLQKQQSAIPSLQTLLMTPHTQPARAAETGQNLRAALTAKENAVFARLEPEPTQSRRKPLTSLSSGCICLMELSV